MTLTTTGYENAKCRSKTRSHPGDIIEPPKRAEIPSGLLQNNSKEYPSTAVGTMNGMSERVSKMPIHLDLWRAMSHAMGMPVTRSIAETSKATVKEF